MDPSDTLPPQPIDGAAPRGTCAGFAITSDLPLVTLRPGTGDPLSVVEGAAAPAGEVIAVWEPRPGNPFHGRLVTSDGRYGFWASDVGWYAIDPAGASITVPAGADPLRREARMWGIPMALCLVARGDLSLHGAAIQVGKVAVLLAAPGQHGKTTLAAAFVRAGCRLLAEDATACRPTDRPQILPGPALLRLRPDIAGRIYVPGTRVVREDSDRRYLVLDPVARGDGGPVPLHGIFLLRQGTGSPTIRRIPGQHALPALWSLSFRLPGDDGLAAAFEGLAGLVASVPVYELSRPLTIEALDDVVDLVVETVARGDASG